MWKKDNEIYNGNSIVFAGMRIFNPTPEMLEKAGYVWEEPIIPEPVEVPKRYSTLKIIRRWVMIGRITKHSLKLPGCLTSSLRQITLPQMTRCLWHLWQMCRKI